MKKLTPIVLSEKDDKKLQEQLGVQEISTGAPKSADPLNYPVFSIPVGKKVLVYVPNHVTLDENGVERLRMDKPYTHNLSMGKKYFTHRCTNGVEIEGTGLTGRCPLCDGVSEPWDLANKVIEQRCKAQGLDPANTNDESVKTIRSAEFSKRVIKDAERHYTFPIVVFETLNDDGKTFVKDPEGGIKYKIYWYDISEKLWEEKWAKVIEALNDEGEEDVTHPGGRFYLLNYIYKPKEGQQQQARDAAKALVISVRKISQSDKLKVALDKETEGWTPAKCQQTVLANILYAEEDLQCVADEVLENTRNLLAMYEGAATAGAIGMNGGNAGFALQEVPKDEGNGEVAGELPLETDLETEE